MTAQGTFSLEHAPDPCEKRGAKGSHLTFIGLIAIPVRTEVHTAFAGLRLFVPCSRAYLCMASSFQKLGRCSVV